MDYQFENLAEDRFQQFCQALLSRSYPNTQCFPIRQPDGGRDAIAYLPGRAGSEFIVFQVKYVRKPFAEVDPHNWLVDKFADEAPKVQRLIPHGAKEYVLITNVPGTAHSQVGSIDRVQDLLNSQLAIPATCWWRDDLSRRLDNSYDLKWMYPELMTGQDMLRWLIESGLVEDRERRSSAIRAFLRAQYDTDQEVRFKQIELQNHLLDLFVDVPIALRQSHGNDKQRDLYWGLMNAMPWNDREGSNSIVASPEDPTSERFAYRYLDPTGDERSLGAATMLLHPLTQEHMPRLVLEGAPGQGKSTITQYVCQVHRMLMLGKLTELDAISAEHQPVAVRIPFRVDLRDLATWLDKQDPFSSAEEQDIPEGWHRSLEALLAAQVRHFSGGLSFSVDDLHAVMRVSALLLVLDGLDEVADIAKRQEVVSEVVKGVGRLQEVAASVQVIVTSRPAAFANSPGFPERTFPHYQLLSLTRKQIDEYANKWIRARKLTTRDSAAVRRILKEKLTQPHLRDLARNPMQLAILLSLIHTRGSSLPDKRTALYDNYVSLFFNREAEKNAIVQEHRDLLIEIHQFLAWVLHSEAEEGNSRGSISSERLQKLIADYLESEGRDRSLAEKLFAGMVERVVALVSRVEGTFEFEVQPLREYFAARHLYETAPYSPPGAEHKGTKPDRFDAITRNFYWLNVARFYAGCFSKGELASLEPV